MKFGRSAKDIADLTARLHASKSDGVPISAWLDVHHHVLQSLVPLGWTWDQLADAMNAAGIRYEAGKPRPAGGLSRGRWTGEQLRNAVRHTRARASQRSAAMEKAFSASSAPTQPQSLPLTSSQEAVRRLGERPKPAVRVYGAMDVKTEAPEAEPGSVQRMVDEKSARTQSIIDNFLKGKKTDGSQG